MTLRCVRAVDKTSSPVILRCELLRAAKDDVPFPKRLTSRCAAADSAPRSGAPPAAAVKRYPAPARGPANQARKQVDRSRRPKAFRWAAARLKIAAAALQSAGCDRAVAGCAAALQLLGRARTDRPRCCRQPRASTGGARFPPRTWP